MFEEPGSFGLGFALGFILGLWGLIGCLIFGKRETKRGSGYGFGSRVVLTIVVVAVVLAMH